jgi:hypothetical protein
LWWPARSKRATCSGTSKTWKKVRHGAAHTCPYRSVSLTRGRDRIRLVIAEEDGMCQLHLRGSCGHQGARRAGSMLSTVKGTPREFVTRVRGQVLRAAHNSIRQASRAAAPVAQLIAFHRLRAAAYLCDVGVIG